MLCAKNKVLNKGPQRKEMITWHQDLFTTTVQPNKASGQFQPDSRISNVACFGQEMVLQRPKGVSASNVYLIFVENEAEAQTASLEKNFLKVGF